MKHTIRDAKVLKLLSCSWVVNSSGTVHPLFFLSCVKIVAFSWSFCMTSVLIPACSVGWLATPAASAAIA